MTCVFTFYTSAASDKISYVMHCCRATNDITHLLLRAVSLPVQWLRGKS